MVSSPLRSKTHCHVRSVSLPSRSHPLIPQFNEHLSRVEACEATSSISYKLSCLKDLYQCVDNLFLLPYSTQQVISQQRNEKWVDEVLEGYLRLLDLCSVAKEVISQTKQDVQQLFSMMRMRRRRDANDFSGYFTSRKKAKKVIQKSLKDLKSLKNKHTLLALALDKDHETVATTVSMLNEVEVATLSVFDSLLCYIGCKKVQSRPSSSWSLVSKLMNHKSGTCDGEEAEGNDFEKVDAALNSLISSHKSRSDNNKHIDNLQHQLAKMESNIRDIEEGLECLFRRLIKTRVFLLNILNH